MNHELDPVSVAIVLFSLLLSRQVAEIAGPYTVIALAATTGAAWSLGRQETTSRLEALGYMVKINLTALLVTVGIARIVLYLWPSLQGLNWVLAPIALLVGGIGRDWPAVGRWAVSRVGAIIDRRSGGHP